LTGYLSVQEAQQRIIQFFQAGTVETVPVERCAGRVLAEDLTAPGDLPPFDNSSMDGFAVRSVDVLPATQEEPVALKVVADIPAGSPSAVVIQKGEAARIMTGAPVPAQADAVVPVEDTSVSSGPDTDGTRETWPKGVLIYHGAKPGGNIRRRGSDIVKGQLLLQRGRYIQPQDAGLIATIGRAEVQVFRRPRVALFSSGDELVQPGGPLGKGQIYDSNQYVLAALLEREGAEVLRMGTAPDDPRRIAELLDRAVEQRADMIVTSAGVSVGAYDYVRAVIESRGRLEFWRVNMRPGKPLAFGMYAGIPLIGLPGNPVSSFVGCLMFVLPAVRRLAGREQTNLVWETAVLSEAIESDGRESYLRAIVDEEDGRLVAKLAGHQGSGNIFSLVQANALLIVPSGVKSLPIDSPVKIWYFNRV
jgi:molybdopterin molybdotransferase